MPFATPTPYPTLFNNIHECSLFLKFYETMFNNDTLILVIMVFIGIYCKMVIYNSMEKLKVIKIKESLKNTRHYKRNLFDTFKITQKKINCYDRKRK